MDNPDAAAAWRPELSYAATAWPSADPGAGAAGVGERPAVSLNVLAPRSRFSAGTRTLSSAIRACQIARSVDVEHGLAADAAVQEGVERRGGLAPRALEFDLAVQSSVGGQCAQAYEVARPGGVRGKLVQEV